jgi:hypothetical protein
MNFLIVLAVMGLVMFMVMRTGLTSPSVILAAIRLKKDR